MGVARIDDARAAFLEDLKRAGTDADRVEAVRVKYAGRRSGLLLDLTAALRDLPKEEKRTYGQALNELKQFVAAALEEAKNAAGLDEPDDIMG